jgi:cobalt-zinc-cadmium efflux system membrane fusion protein
MLALLAIGCLAAFAVPPVREAVQKLLAAPEHANKHGGRAKAVPPVELIQDENKHDGLRISAAAITNLELNPVTAEAALRPRPLPPLPGKVNYDLEGMHIIRPRFQGELVELKQVVEGGHPPYGPESKRPLRKFDRVKQGDVLAVLWCKDLGVAKAALVDAVQDLRLSKNTLERQQKLLEEGTISLQTLEATKRQFLKDTGALNTAERTLRIYKYTEKDIDDLKKEANSYLEQNRPRNLDEEVRRWARVDVPVPVDKNNPNREYVVLEMNTNIGDFVDPGRDTPLFRLGDLHRMEIWVHPPEEYVPILRERLSSKYPPGSLRWQIRFQAEPNQPPLELPVTQMGPSLEPNQYTPMLLGYLPNRERRYLVGQFVTATIFVPPPEDTVEIPTDALNQYEGQQFVIVQHPERKNEFFLRRVVLVSNSGGVSLVRSKLTAEDEELSKQEVAQGRRPLEPLRLGERTITRGVVELTSKIDELVTEQAAEQQQQLAPKRKG